MDNKSNATATTPAIDSRASVSGKTALTDVQLKQLQDALGSQGADNFKRVFAYQMKENIALFGASKVEKMQGDWIVTYICNKLKADAKQLETRLENKRILAEAKANG